jgi:hypothetical protein
MASKTASVLALLLCIPVVSRDDDTSDVMGFGWCLIVNAWAEEAVRKLMTIRVVTRIRIGEVDPQRCSCIGDTKLLTKVSATGTANVDGGNIFFIISIIVVFVF